MENSEEEALQSSDGYELLHEELMDQISVSIQDSNFGGSSSSFKFDEENKKMKISLSQEQLRLNGSGSKNFLTVPVSAKKQRSASFSSPVARRRSVTIFTASDVISKRAVDNNVSEIIYAVPQKQQISHSTSSHCATAPPSGIKTSSASSIVGESSKGVVDVVAANSANIAPLCEMNFKYPLAFYCKICNKVLDDPRVLDCLHSFCCQCLQQLDASSDLQNNQIWRKISDASSGQVASSQPSRSSTDSDVKKSLRSSPRKFSLRNAFKDKVSAECVFVCT
jgi:hypothetical protein